MGRAIDVSKYQGVINYDLLPADVDTILMQASFGLNGTDPEFARNYAETRRTGRTPVPYHFAYPAASSQVHDAQAQALHFVNTVQAVAGPKPPVTVRLALDLEEPNGSVAWAQAFLAALIQYDGLIPYFYSYLSYINGTLDGGAGLGSVSLLWLADTGITGPPPCPAGWSEVTLWQDAQGSEPGIQGPVDEDVELHPPASQPAPTEELFDVDPTAFINLVYLAILFRLPEPTALTEWLAYLKVDGPIATMSAIMASPEAKAKRAKIAALLAD